MLIYCTNLRLLGDQDVATAFSVVGEWLSRKSHENVSPDWLRSPQSRRMADGSRIHTIVAESEFPRLYSIKYTHGDKDVPGRQWVTEIGMRHERANGNVEFSVLLRTDEISTRVEAKSYPTAPYFVHEIIKRCSLARHTGGSSVTVLENAAEVEAFAYAIEYSERDYPYVLISPTPEGTYLVDADKLQFHVEGVADVVQIPLDSDTFQIAKVLGYHYAAWRGAIKIIYPEARSRSRTSFPVIRLLPDDLREMLQEGVDLEKEIFSMIMHRINLPNSWRHTSPDKVSEAIRRRELIHLKEKYREEGELSEFAQKYIAHLEEDNRQREEKISQLSGEIDALQAEWQQSDEARRDLQYQIDSLKLSLRGSQGERGRENTFADRTLRAFTNVIEQAPTLTESLIVISTLYPDRVEILRTAWESADDSKTFQYKKHAFELLWKLVTEYWEALVNGKGDLEARNIFGNRYAANEGEAENNARARQLRTFEYRDELVEMMRHLKIGVKESVAETWRTYFYWDADEKKIVIGHCGCHLDHK